VNQRRPARAKFAISFVAIMERLWYACRELRTPKDDEDEEISQVVISEESPVLLGTPLSLADAATDWPCTIAAARWIFLALGSSYGNADANWVCSALVSSSGIEHRHGRRAATARPIGPTRGSQSGAQAGRRALEECTSTESGSSGDR